MLNVKKDVEEVGEEEVRVDIKNLEDNGIDEFNVSPIKSVHSLKFKLNKRNDDTFDEEEKDAVDYNINTNKRSIPYIEKLDYSRTKNDSAFLALQSYRAHEISKIIRCYEQKELALDD